jgi:hypothetical protein
MGGDSGKDTLEIVGATGLEMLISDDDVGVSLLYV